MVKCGKTSFSLPNNNWFLVLLLFHRLILLVFFQGKQRQTIKQTVDGMEIYVLFCRCWTKCEYIYIYIVYCQPLIGELKIHDMKFMKQTLTFSSQSCLLEKKSIYCFHLVVDAFNWVFWKQLKPFIRDFMSRWHLIFAFFFLYQFKGKMHSHSINWTTTTITEKHKW